MGGQRGCLRSLIFHVDNSVRCNTYQLLAFQFRSLCLWENSDFNKRTSAASNMH
jgi:hypothetical protein